MDKFQTLASQAADPVPGLTERQRQCMVLVAEGLTSKQIARQLGISPSTVDNHVRAVIVHLSAANRLDAARIVVSWINDSSSGDSQPDSANSNAGAEMSVEQGGEVRGLVTGLPPFGGFRNTTAISKRFLHVAQVALLGTMVFAALTATIAGIVSLFAR